MSYYGYRQLVNQQPQAMTIMDPGAFTLNKSDRSWWPNRLSSGRNGSGSPLTLDRVAYPRGRAKETPVNSPMIKVINIKMITCSSNTITLLHLPFASRLHCWRKPVLVLLLGNKFTTQAAEHRFQERQRLRHPFGADEPIP